MGPQVFRAATGLEQRDGKIMTFRRFCRQFYPDVRELDEQPIKRIVQL